MAEKATATCLFFAILDKRHGRRPIFQKTSDCRHHDPEVSHIGISVPVVVRTIPQLGS